MKSFTKLMLAILLFNCPAKEKSDQIEYREEMRDFVIALSEYAKKQDPGFIVIPQNGHELITTNGQPNGAFSTRYLNAVDALAQENLYYGYPADNERTDSAETAYMMGFLEKGRTAGKPVLIADYVWDSTKVDDSYAKNDRRSFVSFAANRRELDEIPVYPSPIPGENKRDITSMDQVRNFLYLLNYAQFSTKQELLTALASTNYDLIIMDAFYAGELLSQDDLNQINSKANGGKRLLVSYMSIGEAGDFRYYWQPSWQTGNPQWIDEENPDWEGNFKVQYWEEEWQEIIYGDEDSYLQQILDAGFDGVYLDIIDAFWYYENRERNG